MTPKTPNRSHGRCLICGAPLHCCGKGGAVGLLATVFSALPFPKELETGAVEDPYLLRGS